MKIATTFARTKNKIGYFAGIELESYFADSFNIDWDDSNNDVRYCKKMFGSAVEQEILNAYNLSIQLNERKHAFRIIGFVELPTDTEESAVRCATIKAAWIALGHDEKQVEFEFDGSWKAKINLDL